MVMLFTCLDYIMLTKMMRKFSKVIDVPNSLRKILREDDVFVFDRGVRDVKLKLEDENFKVLISRTAYGCFLRYRLTALVFLV